MALRLKEEGPLFSGQGPIITRRSVKDTTSGLNSLTINGCRNETMYKKPADVVQPGESIEMQVTKCASDRSTMAFKHRGNITQISKQGYQWPDKKYSQWRI